MNTNTAYTEHAYSAVAAEIWALLKEVSLETKEIARESKEIARESKESARESKERFREIEQLQKETKQLQKEIEQLQKETALQMKETDRQMKETDRKMGRLTNRFGELIEHLVAPGLREKFRALGYSFENIGQRYSIENMATGQSVAEIDVWLANGAYCMAVEVKSSPTTEDVAEHVDRLKNIRAHFDVVGDKRKIIGAMAGAVFSKESRDFALKKGFFVLAQSGDTVLVDVPEGFKPREW